MYYLSGILKCFVFNYCYKSMDRDVCLKQGRKISERVFLVTGISGSRLAQGDNHQH